MNNSKRSSASIVTWRDRSMKIFDIHMFHIKNQLKSRTQVGQKQPLWLSQVSKEAHTSSLLCHFSYHMPHVLLKNLMNKACIQLICGCVFGLTKLWKKTLWAYGLDFISQSFSFFGICTNLFINLQATLSLFVWKGCIDTWCLLVTSCKSWNTDFFSQYLLLIDFSV